MTIYVKNKYRLQVDDFTFKCCVGKNGVSKNKVEGDKKTPIGVYHIENLYYRKDRIKRPFTKLKCVKIKKNMGWCDDPKSKQYNKLVKLPFNYRHEKLYKKENVYDIILVLDYNMRPVKKNKGSAVFIHVVKNNFKKTEGCVAIKINSLKKLIKEINPSTKVNISLQK